MDGSKCWIERKDLEGQDALEDWDNQEPEEPEILCSPEELVSKVATLAEWMRQSKGKPIVFHVGAGMMPVMAFQRLVVWVVFGRADAKT
jgi:hypothetical protein